MRGSAINTMLNKKQRIYILAILLISQFGFAQDINFEVPSKNVLVQQTISLFKEKKIDEICAQIKYPLNRPYPIADVKNSVEMKERFKNIFDDHLIQKISKSNTEDWHEVGWRGIMLYQGLIWLESGTGKIIAVNYESDFEKNLKQFLIKKDKAKVHSSIKNFEAPVYKIKTMHYLIRIDETTEGQYRYASWKVRKSESSRPDLILQNGKLEMQGSGGNHVIIFQNKEYTYKIYRNIIGEEDHSDITLTVEKNDKIILSEDGKLLEFKN